MKSICFDETVQLWLIDFTRLLQCSPILRVFTTKHWLLSGLMFKLKGKTLAHLFKHWAFRILFVICAYWPYQGKSIMWKIEKRAFGLQLKFDPFWAFLHNLWEYTADFNVKRHRDGKFQNINCGSILWLKALY